MLCDMGTIINRQRVMKQNSQYTLVDYIENTYGGAMIDTGITMQNSTMYKFTGIVKPVMYKRNVTPLFVNRGGTDAANIKWRWSWNNDPNYWYVLGGFSSINVKQFQANLIGVKVSFELKNGSFIYNGNILSLSTTPSGAYVAGNMVLMENSTNSGIARWYAFDAFLDDVPIKKLRPCLTKDGIYTMVNILDDTFCNVVGTQPFTGGYE